MKTINQKGYTLLEIIIVIVIIATLTTIAIVTLSNVRKKARDTKRKHDVAYLGRFMSASCYLPNGGAGEYDLSDLVAELKTVNPKYAQYLKQVPMDPRTGTIIQTNYVYTVTSDGKHCALYANLENEEEKITLENLSDPTPGGGPGVLQGSSVGVNDTNIYYQYSSN